MTTACRGIMVGLPAVAFRVESRQIPPSPRAALFLLATSDSPAKMVVSGLSSERCRGMDFRTLPRMDRRPREYYDPKDHRYVSREKFNMRAAADLVRECAAEAMGTSFRDEHVSPVEIDLLAAMWYCGLEPWPQYSLAPYWADFYFPETHVAVEVDGRQWHQVDRDRKRDAYLRDVHDVVVRRFTAQSVYTNPLAVARDVEGTYTWIFDRLHLIVPAARKAA